ncbi:pyrimidine utilization protein D [Sphingomonas sp. HITSZ_GF]|uniref:pyrimidine utilization protein D n=1 Tax=Sphingomonas sp. HITSZ_GF TaxID=3037247 RepID=UPI00240D638E|nr:pyrimidine utilization protein D [Sphingomonas sp. HITSZ_GF]MDG2533770.1 pyrimidine utilization protein D [Sphingomonas sp. HITSZ_GF]
MAEAGGLYYEVHGPANAPALVLSSGLGGSASYWTPNVAALAKQHRVILYDHRGTGRSGPLPEGRVTVEDFADDIVQLLDALGIARASVIGHAAGGVAGLALALKAPDRIDRLIVINGWAELDPHFARCFDVRLTLLRHGGPRAYLRAQPIFLYPANWISDHSAALDAELEQQLAHFPDADTLSRRIAALRSFDIAGDLGAIATPTLLVVAEDDMLVPPHCARQLAAGLPRAQLGPLGSGGHACNVTRPDLFNRLVLAWLGQGDE